MRFLVYSFFLIILLPCQLSAQGNSNPPGQGSSAVIGVDQLFEIEPVEFLKTTGNEPYNDVFNYFFTIQIFAGLMALFLRICLRVLRM